ncbi:MAG: GNAT family N-acetyltransferase [Saprospiraceae bacterium]
MTYQFTNKATAEALYDAFQAEPFYLAIANARTNKKESVKEALIKYFDFSIQEAKKYGICHTKEKQDIGASLWLKPQTEEVWEQQSQAKKAFLKNHFGAESVTVYKKIVRGMEEMEETVIEDDYWYLSILAVAKTYQGQGFGKQLLAPVLAEADKLGITTYLETFTEVNLIFYGKLGYEVALEYVAPILNKTCWILVRHPSKQ